MEQTVREKRIRIIPATKEKTPVGGPSGRKLRVAAYCRVSTDSEEQLTSYTSQKEYYTQKIGENPDWEFAGIFADRGITGTSMKKRAEFNRMIAACKRGRIDLILTKSLSRFARNTVDCLATVRMLRGRGIAVHFEKENINTLTEAGEFMITLFSGFAQAESESIRNNVIWGILKSREAGNVPFQYTRLLGYRRGADGEPEIDAEEAEVVRRIYRRYLDGASIFGIQRELEQEHVPTATGVKQWSWQTIHNILINERYIGDALLQKTYTTDCISKKIVRNTGEYLQGYVLSGKGGDGPPGQQAEGDAEDRQDGAGEVFLQVRSQRTADLRRVRDALQALYLGQERQKADCLAVCFPPGIREEILP